MLLYIGGHVTHGPGGKRLKNVTERVSNLAALCTFVDVRRNERDAVAGEFAVEEGHDFFGSNGMRCGIHKRYPFCALGSAASWSVLVGLVLVESFEAVDTDGSNNSRRAVRARKRRDLTVFSGSCKRSAISA